MLMTQYFFISCARLSGLESGALVLMQLFKTVIRPQLEYASVIWNPTAKGQIGRIEKVQR